MEEFYLALSSLDVWLELKKHMFRNKKSSNAYNYRSGDAAASNGYLSLIKYSKKLNFTYLAINYAATNGHLEIVKSLHENGIEGCADCASDDAAKNGHFAIVKWFDRVTGW